MAHVGGRPTKYTPEMVARVDEYLATCVDTEGEFHKTRGDKSNSYEQTRKVNLPKIEGFSVYVDIAVPTLLEWAKLYPGFSKALEKIKKEQHNRLIDETLSGNYNPVIAKLMLSSNHGYREKADLTTDGEKISFVIPQDVAGKYTNTSRSAEENSAE